MSHLPSLVGTECGHLYQEPDLDLRPVPKPPLHTSRHRVSPLSSTSDTPVAVRPPGPRVSLLYLKKHYLRYVVVEPKKFPKTYPKSKRVSGCRLHLGDRGLKAPRGGPNLGVFYPIEDPQTFTNKGDNYRKNQTLQRNERSQKNKKQKSYR